MFGKSYDTLKKAIMGKNTVPDYFANSVSTPIPLFNIDESNWMEIGLLHRRRFFLEVQYREYFVDYLLNEIFPNPRLYKECMCYKKDLPNYYIDNIVKTNDKLVMVEAN